MKNKKALIAQIGRNLNSAPRPEPSRRAAPPAESAKEDASGKSPRPDKAVPAPSAPSAGTGKQAAFWLDDEDRTLFHEMGMLLYSQGIKPSHNLVLRAAIRMAPRDHRLVEKVRELMENDGRKVRHKKKSRLDSQELSD